MSSLTALRLPQKAEMCVVLLVTLVQLGCLYALPYFVHCIALGQPRRPSDLPCIGSNAWALGLSHSTSWWHWWRWGWLCLQFGHMFGEEIAAGFVLWRAIRGICFQLWPQVSFGPQISHDHELSTAKWNRFRQRFSAFVNGEKALCTRHLVQIRLAFKLR